MLAPDPVAVRQARAFVRQQCADRLDDDTCSSAVLLTSEIVTNAFLHGRSEARLAVTIGPRTIRVEVGDDNSRQPRLVEPDPDALDGRGLALVGLLADDWGVRTETYGKTVWFVVAGRSAS